MTDRRNILLFNILILQSLFWRVTESAKVKGGKAKGGKAKGDNDKGGPFTTKYKNRHIEFDEKGWEEIQVNF